MSRVEIIGRFIEGEPHCFSCLECLGIKNIEPLHPVIEGESGDEIRCDLCDDLIQKAAECASYRPQRMAGGGWLE